MGTVLDEVTEDSWLRGHFKDAEWVAEYLDAGAPSGDPIYLSLGETWSEAPEGLARLLGSGLPSYAHGYVISQYGLPALQRLLRGYVARTHALPAGFTAGADFEVAVTCSGTRNAMFDYGRLVLADAPRAASPTVIAPAPGWDYRGVFAGLGFRMTYLPLAASQGFQPAPEALREALGQAGDPRGVIVVINAQHNPTGVNWDEDLVADMVRLTVEARANLLIDDAYYGVTDPGVAPTSALRLLAERLARPGAGDRPVRWLAVRSLGKQFNCNGWGIGVGIAPPPILDRLVNDFQLQRSFTAAVPLQNAMARWLDGGESEEYLRAFRQGCADKRAWAAGFLRQELGCPAEALCPGNCTSYFLFRVPPPYAADARDGVTRFRRDCLRRAGVLLGAGTMTPQAAPEEGQAMAVPYVRMFLGPPMSSVETALHRLAEAGTNWERSC
ncbi:aminotransferase class I/II-fold pyridoxal phosphate-dependent enzyme [Nonomuraea sp. NPDC001636]|uniref:aminotransferase class I/II-fold pyridoxal phosphate-dependent enzyme n=1 Tax=Nonomuraea sp. NPDC001636 TaxID=3154391 RepID=UPI003332E692